MPKAKKVPQNIFNYIEKHMPFSSVDMIIRYGDQGIILTKRSIRPYNGWWHLPGSVILKNEKMADTIKRSAKEELGIEVADPMFIGNYELFTKSRHYITHTFAVEYKAGKIKLDSQSSDIMIIDPRNIPNHTIPIQKLMINDALRKGRF